MTTDSTYDYGLWYLVILSIIIVLAFTLSFFKPRTKADWRAFGIFTAFIVALFTEMFGFPLTIYLFSGWIMRRLPNINIYSHDNGHLLAIFFPTNANPHFGVLHVAGSILIIIGFIIVSKAWKILYNAQQKKQLAEKGLYSRIRHPQYTGFALIMLGFLFQWPTLVTLIMFPILLFAYYRLALSEEKDSLKLFGKEYKNYLQRVPHRFIPTILNRSIKT